MYLPVVCTEYRKHDKSTYFWLKVQTFCVKYQYVPVCTEYILFAYSCTNLSTFLKDTYQVHADSGGVHTFWFLILLCARQAAQPVCS
jgi:hypothetical protein